MRMTSARSLRAMLLGGALSCAVCSPALAAKQTATAAKTKAKAKARPRELTFGRFGKVSLLHPKGEPKSVVLFLSGDGGWSAGVVDMGRSLVAEGALVLGLNTPRYLQALDSTKVECADIAGDLEALSQFVQKQLGMERSLHPVVVGYSSGATLAYAALAQSPEGRFQGAMSLGFCADQDMSTPICEANGLTRTRTPNGKGELLAPVKQLSSPWYVLGGTLDETCSLANVEAFAKELGNAHVVRLEKVGHGFSKPRHWLQEFLDSYRAIPVEPEPTPTAPDAQPTAPAQPTPTARPPVQDAGTDAGTHG
ncbi:AcvB/VirJ family lysyl-phosphatidylglycerol hydrolase [Archangium sp.]|uniref:AcvB/VirJ family lysyl-phosphatidylglycerol hydrolase n=1 Tax=Archangium sp. TaxID=1872627 RepID=UPI00389AAE63